MQRLGGCSKTRAYCGGADHQLTYFQPLRLTHPLKGCIPNMPKYKNELI